MKSCKKAAVILCAGKGERARLGYNKTLHPLGSASVAAKSADAFSDFDEIIVVCRPEDEEFLRGQIDFPALSFVRGGETRTDSVRNALKAIKNAGIVSVHDGARPFVTREVVDRSVECAIKYGSGVAATKSVNAIRRILADGTTEIADRNEFYVVQTPQSFDFEKLKAAYEKISGSYPDDATVFELAGYPVHISEGDPDNVKLTSPADFAGLGGEYRVGFGFDVHPFRTGRDLILCGVGFDSPVGLDGHSDADAPVHAVMDALLSAAGLPDIGVRFPDTDPKFEGADSIGLLKNVVSRLPDCEIVNVSVCIIAQKPKIAPRRKKMCAALAAALGINETRVNVSATTSELLGITGEGKGLAASCDVLIKLKK